MDTDDDITQLMIAREKRDQALACGFLSFIIALALVVSNVGRDHKTEEAMVLVRQHRELLAQNQSVLQINQAELTRDQMALEAILKSRKPIDR
jgi:hypothetical protein